jgi:hypothetical protein
VQVIERLGLGELIGIGDALREIIPGDDGLDGCVRISARLFGFQQCMADFREQPYLVIDRLTLFLELLLMFVLGGTEELDQYAVMQIDYFIGHRGCALQDQCDQGGITPLALELGKILRRHLPAFPCHLQQAILMDVAAYAFWQRQFLECLQTFDVLQHVPGVRLYGGLA